MNRGRLVLALAASAAAWACPAAAEAELRFRDCSEGRCARLVVPLDHRGAVPGSLTLRVSRTRSGPPSRGVAVVLAGGPGGPGSGSAYEWSERMPRYDIVTIEPRGTGAGGLRCRDLEAATQTDAGREAEACAALLGERRGLFRAADTVEDLELLRRELGAERFTLVGSGYGSYVVQRYALRYADRVERMVLEGVVDAAGVDPLYLDSGAAARRVLPELCRSACSAFTRDPLGDTSRLIDRLAQAPLRGAIVGPTGRRRAATLTRQDLRYVLLAGDTNVIARADYPAAVVSALRGDAAPLLRLKRRAAGPLPERLYPTAFSAAAYAAAACEEIRFPWSWGASPPQRDEAAYRTQSEMDPALAWPFDPGTLVRSDVMRLCRRWPTASSAPPPEPGPMPDVPVLLLADRTQLRLSVETALRTAQRFPRAQLLVTSAPPWLDDCADRAVNRFVSGRPVQARCPRAEPPLRAGRPKPVSFGELRAPPRLPGRRGQLASAVGVTFGDLFDDLYSRILSNAEPFLDEDVTIRIGGLRGGFAVLGEEVFRLRRYEVVRGVRISGRSLDLDDEALLRVDGPGRLNGMVRISDISEDGHAWLRGRLAGRRVRVRVALATHLFELFAEDGGGGGGSAVRGLLAQLVSGP